VVTRDPVGGLGVFEAALLLEHERLAARLTPWERGQGWFRGLWNRRPDLGAGGGAKEDEVFPIVGIP